MSLFDRDEESGCFLWVLRIGALLWAISVFIVESSDGKSKAYAITIFISFVLEFIIRYWLKNRISRRRKQERDKEAKAEDSSAPSRESK